MKLLADVDLRERLYVTTAHADVADARLNIYLKGSPNALRAAEDNFGHVWYIPASLSLYRMPSGARAA